MQLRKVCAHPFLIEQDYYDGLPRDADGLLRDDSAEMLIRSVAPMSGGLGLQRTPPFFGGGEGGGGRGPGRGGTPPTAPAVRR